MTKPYRKRDCPPGAPSPVRKNSKNRSGSVPFFARLLRPVPLLLFFAVLLGIILLFALRCNASKPAEELSAVSATEIPAVSATEAPAVPDSEEPTVSLPEPSITDPWYMERCEQIASNISSIQKIPYDDALRIAYSMDFDPSEKAVAFTFDDGPNKKYTGQILDILEKYNARATFFVNGFNIDGNEDLLSRMLCLGCEIGNHTWNHSNLEELSDSEMYSEVVSVNDKIGELFHCTVRLFRPPYIKYGKHDKDIRDRIISLLKDQNMAMVNHSRSTHDTYEEYTADMIFERAVMETDELGHTIDRSIILCHDKSRKMVEAFEKIVPELIDRGYQLVTVSELLCSSEEGLNPGWIYSKAD